MQEAICVYICHIDRQETISGLFLFILKSFVCNVSEIQVESQTNALDVGEAHIVMACMAFDTISGVFLAS